MIECAEEAPLLSSHIFESNSKGLLSRSLYLALHITESRQEMLPFTAKNMLLV